jgi:hypothetical protein
VYGKAMANILMYCSSTKLVYSLGSLIRPEKENIRMENSLPIFLVLISASYLS